MRSKIASTRSPLFLFSASTAVSSDFFSSCTSPPRGTLIETSTYGASVFCLSHSSIQHQCDGEFALENCHLGHPLSHPHGGTSSFSTHFCPQLLDDGELVCECDRMLDSLPFRVTQERVHTLGGSLSLLMHGLAQQRHRALEVKNLLP